MYFQSVRKASLAEKAAKEAMNTTSTEVEKVKAIIAKLSELFTNYKPLLNSCHHLINICISIIQL